MSALTASVLRFTTPVWLISLSAFPFANVVWIENVAPFVFASRVSSCGFQFAS